MYVPLLQKYTQDNYDSEGKFEISQEDIIINEENQQQRIKVINAIFKELSVKQRELSTRLEEKSYTA